MTFENRYDHKTVEKHWQAYWQEQGVYAYRGDQERAQTFVIDTPPPTVSGQLHMGHIYSYAHADFIARHRRMKGFDVFYPMGFDDNGLPTERLVEKQKKIRAKDVSRETFISLCEDVSSEARLEYRALFTATALSVDWALEYHTISEEVRRLSQASFIDLYDPDPTKTKVERKLQPMLWDTVDQTAIAQAEVEDKELEGIFVDIRFEVCNKDGTPLNEQEFGNRKLNNNSDQNAITWQEGKSYIVIGTTRPEMLPACVGIYFNKDDIRYQGLKEKQVFTPLFGVKVDIRTDETVEMEKGTGIMMCCTFGDEADIIKWRKHDLDAEIIINKYGKIDLTKVKNKDLSDLLEGLLMDSESWIYSLHNKTIKTARLKMTELLNEAGALVSQRNITHAVKCAERSGEPLEILPSQQWFVKVLEHKQALKDRSLQCNWNPAWMSKRMEQWIDGLNWDWCISRQRIYGVPFPLWYFVKVEGTLTSFSEFEKDVFLPSFEQLPVNPLTNKIPEGFKEMDNNSTEVFGKEWIEAMALEDFPQYKIKQGDKVFFTPDTDVMDTWATSSLTPQITAGAVVQPNEKLFPADLRPQAHEIIRTWAFYTLVKAHLHNDDVPWRNLMISGWCLAADKTKMSKSKGNVITPLSLLEEKSADSVRHWAATAKLGSDTAFSEDLLKIGAKLTNKLWNAAKFAHAQLEAIQGETISAAAAIQSGIITCQIDKWLIARVKATIKNVDEAFTDYDYATARTAIEDLFWNDFCDNYLEIVKARAYGQQGDAAQQSALHTIYHVFNAILKLFAPFIPHITEELFSKLYAPEFAKCGSIHARGNFPNATDFACENSEGWEQTKAIVELIRKAKSERGVSIKYPFVQASILGISPELFQAIQADIQAVGNIAQLSQQQLTQAGAILQDGDLQLEAIFATEAEVA